MYANSFFFFNNSCYTIPLRSPRRINNIRVKGGTPKIIQNTISFHVQQKQSLCVRYLVQYVIEDSNSKKYNN